MLFTRGKLIFMTLALLYVIGVSGISWRDDKQIDEGDDKGAEMETEDAISDESKSIVGAGAGNKGKAWGKQSGKAIKGRGFRGKVQNAIGPCAVWKLQPEESKLRTMLERRCGSVRGTQAPLEPKAKPTTPEPTTPSRRTRRPNIFKTAKPTTPEPTTPEPTRSNRRTRRTRRPNIFKGFTPEPTTPEPTTPEPTTPEPTTPAPTRSNRRTRRPNIFESAWTKPTTRTPTNPDGNICTEVLDYFPCTTKWVADTCPASCS